MEFTDWFGPDVAPTIPGSYECRKNEKGFHCRRVFDGKNWLSPMDNKSVSAVTMEWRGIEPGSVDVELYPSSVRSALNP